MRAFYAIPLPLCSHKSNFLMFKKNIGRGSMMLLKIWAYTIYSPGAMGDEWGA